MDSVNVDSTVRYARSADGAAIAYRVLSDGPIDLVFNTGLIVMDRRGTGLSDVGAGLVPLEEEVDDLLAVLDHAGSERAALMAYTNSGPLFVKASAMHPERIPALILYAAMARVTAVPDYDWTHTIEEREAAL